MRSQSVTHKASLQAAPAYAAPGQLTVGSTAAALFVSSLALYVGTMAPGLTWRNDGGDSGDLLTAAFGWGVPHPTGYPAYILGLRLFSWVVPVGDEAFRGNLFSATTAAATVPFVFLAARAVLTRLSGAARGTWASYLFAVFGAAAFAVSSVFWSQATITEVYALNALFAAALLWLALDVRARVDARRPAALQLSLWAFMLGLGLGNHVTLILVAVPLALWVYWPVVRVRNWRAAPIGRPLTALLAGLTMYAYPPLASSQEPALSWGHPHTWDGFKWMVTGSIYQNYAFAVEGGHVLRRVLKVFDFLSGQYGYAGMVLGFGGLSTLWSRERGLAAATFASALGVAVYAVGYSPRDSYVYLIPSFMAFAVWMSAGAAALAATLAQLAHDGRLPMLREGGRWAVPAVVVLVIVSGPAWILPVRFSDMDLRGEREAADYARQAMASAGDGAVILADDVNLFSLWYQSYIAEPERDVLIVSPALLRFGWYWEDLHRQAPGRMPESPVGPLTDRIKAVVSFNEGRTPVFLTHNDKSYSSYFQLEAAGNLYRVAASGGMRGG
jgi:hypothetical protein